MSRQVIYATLRVVFLFKKTAQYFGGLLPMEPRNNTQDRATPAQGRHENPLPNEISAEQKALNEAAHREAESDIQQDADLSVHSPNDDLDEGESARLGENVPV